jgi:activator of HSP90 ATPase
MTTQLSTRRDFSVRLATLFPVVGIAGTSFTSAAGSGVPGEIISHNAEAIHQEIVFKASPKRIYETLTSANQFDQLVELTGMALKDAPTKISSEVGGEFSLFAGHIVGRHIELVPNQRIVQAWRVVVWSPGVYSIAKFELTEQGPATKLIFDHTGFPEGQGQHLADGWKEHYWDTLEKYLAATGK